MDAALSLGTAPATAVSFAQRLRADEDTACFAAPRTPFDPSSCCCKERCSVWFGGGRGRAQSCPARSHIHVAPSVRLDFDGLMTQSIPRL